MCEIKKDILCSDPSHFFGFCLCYFVAPIHDTARNTFAAYGLDILKPAVLLVLYQTDAETLSVKEIREQIGLDDENIGNNLIQGVLEYLKAAETVENDGWGLIGRWRITEKGRYVIERSAADAGVRD